MRNSRLIRIVLTLQGNSVLNNKRYEISSIAQSK